VDAMTALLLVLFFVISIFMIVQFVLADTVDKQDEELSSLSQQVAGLADALGLEQSRGRALNTELGELNSALSEAENQRNAQTALISTLTQQRDSLQAQASESAGRITDFETQIAALLLQNRSLEGTVAATLASLDAEAEAARLAAARTEALRAMIADLETAQSGNAAQVSQMQTQVSQMQTQIESATQALFLAEAAKRAAQLSASERSGEITRLRQARDAAQAQLASLRGELDTATTALGDNREEALQAASDLRAQISALTEARRTLSEDLNSEQMARIAVLKQLRDAQGELDRNTENAAQTEAERLRLEALLADNENQIAAAELALAERAAALSEAERGRLAEAAAAEALRTRMANADAELTAMTLQLDAERQRAQDTLTQLAALRAAQRELSGQDAQNLEVITSQQAALQEAERLLAAEESRSLEAQRQVELLNQQTAALRQELNQLQGLLDASSMADTEAQIRIETLGSDLNTALARVAAEERARANAESRENELLAAEAARLEAEANDLRSFRSEFFGRMREVLGGRDELQVVGDRFVFSSEVLFEPGSATLGREGQNQLSNLASVIRELEGEIPAEINWILQVEGHTDATGSAASNWVLSQGRALSVVTYLIDVERLTPEHLSAAGFGEFQPIAEGDSLEALAANRRIELKLTER